MKKYLVFLVLLNAIPLFGQNISDAPIMHPGSVSDFIGEDWHILDSAKGDLNKDGLEDVALVLESNYSPRVVEADSTYIETSDSNPRSLLILMKRRDGLFTLTEESGTFIPFPEEYKADPFEGIEIVKGVLWIDILDMSYYGSWWVTKARYKFRFQNGQFELIGADRNSLHRSSLEFENLSFNFLSKKWTNVKGKDVEEGEELVPTTEITQPLQIKHLKTFKTFISPFSWEVVPGFVI
ncbi:MAG: hypothetical protein J7604_24190 [Sporocytophaga sp.]|uniref:hypothetical protein n=1 Tax=Sporocytophaga sp. TaxID=2231183 RepID=UPI001AFD478D|nr:hypothetical protein [Sporocytophaga sp.]MBO9703336.1 hypothetical protein [Sporocytophaga sp.]